MIVQKWSKNFNPIEKWRKRCLEIFGKCPTEGSNICKVEQIVMNMKKPPFFISYSVRIDEHAHKVAWEISHLSEQLHDSHASHAYQSTSITIEIIIFFYFFSVHSQNMRAQNLLQENFPHKHNTILCSAYLIELR